MDEKMFQIVKSSIPGFGSEIATIVSDIVTSIIKERMYAWKNGSIATISDMIQKIKEDCSEENLATLLKNNKVYTDTIEKGLKDNVGKDIAMVNAPFEAEISAMVSLSAGISAKGVMIELNAILSLASEILAGAIVVILVNLGPATPPILTAILGLSVVTFFKNECYPDSVKELLKDKVMEWNSPQWLRECISNDKIDECIKKADIQGRMKNIFNTPKIVDDIAENVMSQLKA